MYWNFHKILIGSQAPRLRAEDGPIIVEIGFGNGEYLEHLARTRPEALVAGIEVSQWCIAKAARRALACGLDNVRILAGDARYLLVHAFEPGSVAEVYMNFPCPWPKRRHTERRVARPQFAGLIANVLSGGGRFTLATDVDWYAQETRDVFAAHAAFETGPVVRNPEREYLTKYERKWREMGRDTYKLTAAKTHPPATHDAIPADEGDELSMEIRCDDAKQTNEALASIKGDILEGRDYKVMFKEVFQAADGTALILVISVDEGFEQHYYLKLIRSGETLRGKVDAVGHPYRTPAVRASIRHLMQKLGAKF